MITPPSAAPRRCDIPALHASIAPTSALQQQRRALYQLATDLLEGAGSRVLDLDVIDSPPVRNRIGDALAGRARLTCSELVGLSALAGVDGGAADLRVTSRPEANSLLAAALDTIGAELGRQHTGLRPPRLLTEADGERFTSALAVLREGVALARQMSPELIDDLLPHVALVGIVDPHRAGRLASASPRDFPGLILLKGTPSTIEVAEALIHESAHQKLFDLAITYDLLNAGSDRCPPFHPPWAPEERRWPLEQTLAAFHAYACLAGFWQDVRRTAGTCTVGADSLLPVASKRSEVIGQWLLNRGDHLGTNAHTLLEGLLGQRPRTTGSGESRGSSLADSYHIDPGLVIRHTGSPDRVLVGNSTQPPQLFWVSGDAATVLEFLGHKPLGEVVDTLAHRWRTPPFAVIDRLTTLLSDLCASGLVTPKEH